MELKNTGITPKKADSINQLQELYQKKIIGMPYYEYESIGNDWQCICLCDDMGSEGAIAFNAFATLMP